MAEQSLPKSISITKHCLWCFKVKPVSEFSSLARIECKECRRTAQQVKNKVGRKAIVERRQLENAIWLKRYKSTCQLLSEIPTDPNFESWLPIPNYEGLYEVSNFGNVRSLWFRNRHTNRPRLVPIVLSQFENELGYRSVSLITERGEKSTQHVHTLVLRAFRGLRANGMVGGHRDGNARNNHLSNLDWITYRENEADKKRHQRHLSGERNHQSKLTEEQVRQMRAEWESGTLTKRDFKERYGIADGTGYKIVHRQAWKHVD